MSEHTDAEAVATDLAALIGSADAATAGKAVQNWLIAQCTIGIGDILAGAAGDLPRALGQTPGLLGGAGQSLIFGTGIRTRALDAAYANAAASATPEGILLAVLVALAEERQARGITLLSGLLAAHRVGEAVGGSAFSAAAGACRLLGLDEGRTKAALGLVPSGTPERTARMGALDAAETARAGLLAALLAEQGVTAPVAIGTDAQGCSKGMSMADAGLLETHPCPDAGALWDRFETSARHSLSRDRIGPVFERLETFDKLTDMVSLTRLLQSSEVGRPEPKTVTFAARGTHEPEETTWVP